MGFPPEHYFQTAAQRIRQAQHLYHEGASFALAIYVGGVAVECLLRAFKGRRDPTFDERHNLLRLFAAIIGVITSDSFSGMETIDRQTLIGEMIEPHLTAEERHRVQVIVGVTPEEGTGYLAAAE
jgi:hypothetical protein